MAFFRLMSAAEKFGLWLGMCAAIVMAIHVSAEIVARTLFDTALTGTIEIVSFIYMIALSFLPLGHVQRNRQHIAADAIASVIPRKLSPYTDMLGRIISIGVTGFLVWAVTDMAIRQTRVGESAEASYFDIPIWPSRWLLPIGLGAMLIIMILQFIKAPLGKAADPQPPVSDPHDAP